MLSYTVAFFRFIVIVAIGITAGFTFHNAPGGLLASLIAFHYTDLQANRD